MTFWTFMLLLAILLCFGVAQLLKLLNSETKSGELARAFAWGVIDRIRRRPNAAPPSEKE